MKNIFITFRITIFVMVISLSVITCDNNTSGGDINNGGNGNGGNDENEQIIPDTPSTPRPFNNITAAQLVANMKIGWNLGNTLDAHQSWLSLSQQYNASITEHETSWGNPVTTKAMITAIKNAGFNVIRIPVTWYKVLDSNFNIRNDWMVRVTEVVNYAVDNDMYIILNTHHDDHGDYAIFKFNNSEKTASLAAFRKVWEQIADNFKNYNEKLIFEALNEPRTQGSVNEWTGGTAEERANLNEHYQVFVDVVRKSGGNNDKRKLMVNTYGTSYSADAVNGLVLPNDPTPNKLIVSIHPYLPYNFALNASPVGQNGSVSAWSSSNPLDTEDIRLGIKYVYEKFVSNGIPVIFGEFGALDKNNLAARVDYTEYFVRYARRNGIVCVWWDGAGEEGSENGDYRIFNRNNLTFIFPEIITALMKADQPLPGVNEPITPNPITGILGNYTFGTNNDSSTNYIQAVWDNLSSSNITLIQNSTAKLVLELSKTPTGVLQLIWQGPDNNLWWNESDILGGSGNVLNASHATWNSGTNTLTINLAQALNNYSNFTAQPSLNLIIIYHGGGGTINSLGIVSANIVVP